jgi:type IV secretion system protein VirD4
VIARTAYDLGRLALKLVIQLWPVWLFWFALHLGGDLWRDHVLATQPDRTTPAYLVLYRAWPSVGLFGPILLMFSVLAAERAQLGSRTMAVAAIAGVALATVLTVQPEWTRLSPYIGHSPIADVIRALDPAMLFAFMLGFLSVALGVRILRGDRLGRGARPGMTRAASDNHGHADWLDMKAARVLFPSPDPAFGGIVVGEAYRVDQDRAARAQEAHLSPSTAAPSAPGARAEPRPC